MAGGEEFISLPRTPEHATPTLSEVGTHAPSRERRSTVSSMGSDSSGSLYPERSTEFDPTVRARRSLKSKFQQAAVQDPPRKSAFIRRPPTRKQQDAPIPPLYETDATDQTAFKPIGTGLARRPSPITAAGLPHLRLAMTRK